MQNVILGAGLIGGLWTAVQYGHAVGALIAGPGNALLGFCVTFLIIGLTAGLIAKGFERSPRRGPNTSGFALWRSGVPWRLGARAVQLLILGAPVAGAWWILTRLAQ